MSDYTTEYYQEVNSYLRTGKSSTSLEHDPEFFPEQDISNLIDTIDSSITAKTSSPMILYRGGGGERLARLDKGAVITDKAFVSTTLNRKYAEFFTNKSRSRIRVLVRIHIPKEQRMAYTGHYRHSTNDPIKTVGTAGDEWEIILPRNTSFRVIKKSRKGNLNIIDLKVVP